MELGKGLLISLVIFSVLLTSTWTAPAQAAERTPFYANKTIKVIVRSTPGGGYDLMSRVVARHLVKYLPGSRSAIVINIPGAGGLIAASYMYHRAKPDGLTIGLLDRAGPVHQLIHPDLAKKGDFRHYRYLGSLVKDASAAVIRKETGIRTMDELIGSKKKFVPGSTTKRSAGYQILFAMQLAWNLPFTKWVLGYPGAAQQVMAMERGENDLIQTTADSFAAMPHLLEIGNILVTATRKRDPRFPQVPTVFEVARRNPPNPKYWPLVELLVDMSEWGRPFVAPPDIPKDRLAVLREAFAKTFKDPEMLGEAKKLRLFVNPVLGEKQEQLIRASMTPSPDRDQLLKMLTQ
ncbi:MAG: tripartite tricarboxylate transporter substrate-binding protein [Desulfatiglandales bacterium]